MRSDRKRSRLGVTEACSFREFLTSYPDQWHLHPQPYWLTDARGRIAIDFVGRFERLQEDFERICERIGKADTKLPTELIAGGPDYTEFYDDETKELVTERYAEEIAMFGYQFNE